MANIITSIRIICALALVFFPTFSKWFYIFYIIAGTSDVLDGIASMLIARAAKYLPMRDAP